MADSHNNDGKAAPVASPLVFAALGRRSAVDDDEFQVASRMDAHLSARKACAALKVASSIVNAVVVYPGGDADDATLNGATVELMRQASELTSAAVAMLGIKPELRNSAGYKNLLKQQAADVVAAQWRMAHSTDKKQLTTEQITKLYSAILATDPLSGDGEMPAYPDDIDAVTAKRVSLLGVAPDVYQAVNSFDYFCPDPQELVIKGVEQIILAANSGLSTLAAGNASHSAMTMVTQSLIGKAGALYATNFRAIARKDVQQLSVMDPDERARTLYLHRSTGLPTAHIDASFHKLMSRMVEMVRDAVPELASEQALSAPRPAAARPAHETVASHSQESAP